MGKETQNSAVGKLVEVENYMCDTIVAAMNPELW